MVQLSFRQLETTASCKPVTLRDQTIQGRLDPQNENTHFGAFQNQSRSIPRPMLRIFSWPEQEFMMFRGSPGVAVPRSCRDFQSLCSPSCVWAFNPWCAVFWERGLRTDGFANFLRGAVARSQGRTFPTLTGCSKISGLFQSN